MDETGNDLDLVRDLINELGKETFSQLTLKEAFDILSPVITILLRKKMGGKL
jgi:hypothetical protein